MCLSHWSSTWRKKATSRRTNSAWGRGSKLSARTSFRWIWFSTSPGSHGFRGTSTRTCSWATSPIVFSWTPKSKKNYFISESLSIYSSRTPVSKSDTSKKISPRWPIKSPPKTYPQISCSTIRTQSSTCLPCSWKFSVTPCNLRAYTKSTNSSKTWNSNNRQRAAQNPNSSALKNSTSTWSRKLSSYLPKGTWLWTSWPMPLRKSSRLCCVGPVRFVNSTT